MLVTPFLHTFPDIYQGVMVPEKYTLISPQTRQIPRLFLPSPPTPKPTPIMVYQWDVARGSLCQVSGRRSQNASNLTTLAGITVSRGDRWGIPDSVS